MENIIKRLHEGNISCVIDNDGDVRTFSQRGIADLYDLYTNECAFLKGASVADKVVGKGAAALMVQSGVKSVYADLISESAYTLLQESGIEIKYKEMVNHIENRDKTDWCPLEKSCNEIIFIKDIIPVIENFIAKTRGFMAILLVTICGSVSAQESIKDTLSIPEVVVTGTRNAVDVRYLPMNVSVVNHKQIARRYESSLLPLLTEQVPRLFTTARGIMGYGVSTGGSGGMSMRGVGGSPTTGMLILIDDIRNIWD